MPDPEAPEEQPQRAQPAAPAAARRRPARHRRRGPRGTHPPGRRPPGRAAGGQLLGLPRAPARALEAALTEYVAGALLDDVNALAERLRCNLAEGGEAAGVDGALDLFQRWLDQRELLVARLELSMAATRDPDLAQLLADHRSRLVEIVATIMEATGKGHGAERAEALVASYDGVLLAALLKPPSERPAFLSRSLELLGTSLAEHQPA